jgi:hypothetical protein
MKKFIAALLISLQIINPLFSADALTQYQRDTDALYRQGAGAEDGGFSAISLSMIGWGIGLVAGVAILAGVLHQSKSGHSAPKTPGHCH